MNQDYFSKEKNKKEDLKLISEEFQRCKQEREEYLEGWKRARADFLNYKKEEKERIERTAKIESENLINDILPIFESFKEGLKTIKDEPVICGVNCIKEQLEAILKRHGLEKIDAEPGMLFDPLMHEAVGEIDSEKPAGRIHETIVPGYKFYDKIIKPVRVLISKEKGQPENKKEKN